MLAVVLAAGSGRRLYPITATRSKAMVPIAGKPMVERVMEQLKAEGVSDYVVVTRPDDDQLKRLLDGTLWRGCVQIAFQHSQRGMADAVSCAVPFVRSYGAKEFALISCDNILPKGHISKLIALRRRKSLDAALTLMSVSENELTGMAAVVLEGERVTRIVEKPGPGQTPSGVGSVACYALSPRILDYVSKVTMSPRGELEFQDALQLLIEGSGAVEGLMTTDRMTLTSPTDLLSLTSFFLHKDSEAAVVQPSLPPDTAIVPPVRIESGASVGSGCRIGPDVYLETGSTIGDRAVIEKTVVLCGGKVAPGSAVRGLVIQASD